jgi:hypothetical protein
MTTSITPLYGDNPHVSVSVNNSLDVGSPRDFDLESSVQVVADGHSVLLDFSAFVFVLEDGSDLEIERKKVADQIRAWNTLMDVVTQAHTEFL